MVFLCSSWCESSLFLIRWFITGGVLATFIYFCGNIKHVYEARHSTRRLMSCVSNVNQVYQTNKLYRPSALQCQTKSTHVSHWSYWFTHLINVCWRNGSIKLQLLPQLVAFATQNTYHRIEWRCWMTGLGVPLMNGVWCRYKVPSAVIHRHISRETCNPIEPFNHSTKMLWSYESSNQIA